MSSSTREGISFNWTLAFDPFCPSWDSTLSDEKLREIDDQWKRIDIYHVNIIKRLIIAFQNPRIYLAIGRHCDARRREKIATEWNKIATKKKTTDNCCVITASAKHLSSSTLQLWKIAVIDCTGNVKRALWRWVWGTTPLSEWRVCRTLRRHVSISNFREVIIINWFTPWMAFHKAWPLIRHVNLSTIIDLKSIEKSASIGDAFVVHRNY